MKSTVWAFIFLMITCSSYAQTVFFYEKYDYIISAINDFRSHPIEYAKVLNIQESELNAKWSLDNISLEMDPVKEEESLFWMANSHLEEMMEFNFIGHSSRNNFSLEDRALYFGYRGIFVGESVIMLCFEDFVSKDKALDILLESLFKDALLKETREGAPLLFKPYTDIGVAFGASKIKINNIEYNAYILCIDFGVYYTDTYFLGRIFEENKIFIPENSIKIMLSGIAGQSFGAFLTHGVSIYLKGVANDYVGKGMNGGKIIVSSSLQGEKYSVLGNTCLYGATGGTLYASGSVGERFAVRNSGSTAVIEGTGDHACEYMTGGIVVILGKTGLNFGAGMTGGIAFIYDISKTFIENMNQELIQALRIDTDDMNEARHYLKQLLKDYFNETRSSRAKFILDNFRSEIRNFWLVQPKNMKKLTLHPDDGD